MGCSSSIPIEYNDNIYLERVDHDDFSEEIVTLSNESKRNILTWKPKTQYKGVVFISHGLHEHALTYNGIAHALTGRNYLVYGIDHVGHGLSAAEGGRKGFVPTSDLIVNDFVAFVKAYAAKEENNGLPVFILCHSMGSLVAINSFKEIEPLFTAAVVSGCPVFPGWAAASPFGVKGLHFLVRTPLMKPTVRMMGSLDPYGPAGPIFIDEISSNPEEVDKRIHDGRAYSGEMMNKTAHSALVLNDNAKELIKQVKLPLLIIHGEDDMLGLVKGAHYVYDNSATDAAHKKLSIYPHAKHELLHENPDILEKTTNEILDYYDSFLADNNVQLEVSA